MEEFSKLKESENKEDLEKNVEQIYESTKKEKYDSFKSSVNIKSSHYNDRPDEEKEEGKNIQLNLLPSLKNNLVMKVYGVISIQFIIAFSCIQILNIRSIKKFFFYDYFDLAEEILFHYSKLLFILIIILSYIKGILKIRPFNYIILFAFSLYPIISSSIIGTLYYYEATYIGVLLIFISSLAIIFYTFLVKNEFSFLTLFIMVLLSQSFVTWFILVIKETKTFYFICGFFLALICGIYLTYDAQLMRENFGNYNSFDEFTFAFCGVYIDAFRLLIRAIINQIKRLLVKIIEKIKNKNIL